MYLFIEVRFITDLLSSNFLVSSFGQCDGTVFECSEQKWEEANQYSITLCTLSSQYRVNTQTASIDFLIIIIIISHFKGTADILCRL